MSHPSASFRCLLPPLLIALTLAAAPAVAASGGARLDIPRTSYAPGEPIEVTFTAPPGLAETAWIGVIPSDVPHGNEDVNDQHDVDYQYLSSGQTHGTVTFTAPDKPGKWDLRLNENDSGGREIASVSFVVRAADLSQARLELAETTFLPGEKVVARFTAPADLPEHAWVGLIPSDTPHGSEDVNDQHDVDYKYLERRTAGTLEFEAPAQPGSWDLRMNENDSGGREIASVSFTVRPPDIRGAALHLERTTFIPGETIQVRFTAPAELPRTAWVGIIPSGVPHGDERINDDHDVDYQYLEKKTSGTLELRAPVEPGSWDLRMNENDSGGREIASVSFTVGEKVTAQDLARQIRTQGRVALYGIHFATGKADLDATATATLDEVGRLLGQEPTLRLRVEGHTDDVGDDASNLELSKRRAESVVRYLVEREGVAADRLEAQGFGESKPVASNKTEEGRAQNRRVELVRLE